MHWNKIKSFLNQPYPEAQGVKPFFISCFWISIFIGLFLYVFEPFGMSMAGEKKAYYCFMFGLITFVISFAYELIIRYVLGIHRDNDQWVFWKWILSVMGILALIAIGNYLFVMVEFGLKLTLRGFTQVLTSTILVGFFPVFFIGFMSTRKSTRRHRDLANDISLDQVAPVEPQTVTLIGQADSISLSIDQIRIIEAMQNYVQIQFREDSGLQNKILRSTLSAMEDQVKGTGILKCHRSFLVNRHHIQKIEGNAQGLRLTLAGLEDRKIPVSRKYIQVFRNLP